MSVGVLTRAAWLMRGWIGAALSRPVTPSTLAASDDGTVRALSLAYSR